MRINTHLKYILIVVLSICSRFLFAQSNISTLKGNIELDSTWERSIYLSHIPTIDKLYSMSNDMIITKAIIDSYGNFQFDIDFLPSEDNLYRLHLTKMGNSPNSLIIGGSYENFMFLILNGDTYVHIEIAKSDPPFKKVSFINSESNTYLNDISKRMSIKDSIASQNDFSMGQFLNRKLNEDLLEIADTSSHFLVSLFALYHCDIETTNFQNPEAINSFLQKWNSSKSDYVTEFRNKTYSRPQDKKLWPIIATAILCLSIGFLIGKVKFEKARSIEKLSVQERKVYDLLKSGASNQEIAENFSISISTVKTHVSKILNKMNVKSRKELMN